MFYNFFFKVLMVMYVYTVQHVIVIRYTTFIHGVFVSIQPALEQQFSHWQLELAKTVTLRTSQGITGNLNVVKFYIFEYFNPNFGLHLRYI